MKMGKSSIIPCKGWVLVSQPVTVGGQGRLSPSVHGCIYSVSQIEIPAAGLDQTTGLLRTYENGVIDCGFWVQCRKGEGSATADGVYKDNRCTCQQKRARDFSQALDLYGWGGRNRTCGAGVKVRCLNRLATPQF
jgi:hypothetical protein